MTKFVAPPFDFPQVAYSRLETPWSLRPLLFKGGAQTEVRRVETMISTGLLGPLREERLPLIQLFYEIFDADIAGGCSRHSIGTRIKVLRRFYSWVDQIDASPTVANVQDLYIEWTEALLERQREQHELKSKTVYMSANIVAILLSRALDLPTSPRLSTRVKRNSTGRQESNVDGSKQNLHLTTIFGHALLDICKCLTTDAIWGGLPIQLKFRNGSVLEEWSGLQSPEKLKTLNSRSPQSHAVNAILKKRQGWEEEKTFRTRHSVINLRIEAELLIFISQTGMNLAQAHKLKMGKFFYQSYGKGYQVKRVFKNRRQGEVEFSIYGHYRSLFENYLRWRNSLFATADNDLLFPLITSRGRSTDIAPTFNGIKRKCSQLSISFVTPRQLRLTRTNWLMRQTRNVALVSQMNQHEPRTLLDSYERPHHQVALTEITRFFNQSEQALSSPAPGACGRKKNEAVDLPHENLPVPDCLSAAGCLFCSHHRDIDSEDHAWSLASYRYLKSLELSKYKPLRTEAGQHPAKTVIEILSHKLLSFAQSSPVRTQWVTEANARIVEGNYHPKWDGFIQLIEIQYGN